MDTGSVIVNGSDSSLEAEFPCKADDAPDAPDFYVKLTAWEYLHFIATANSVEKDFEENARFWMERYGLFSAKGFSLKPIPVDAFDLSYSSLLHLVFPSHFQQ